MPGIPLHTHRSHKYVSWTVVLRLVAKPPSPGAETGGSAPANLPEVIPAAPSITALCAISSSQSAYGVRYSLASALTFDRLSARSRSTEQEPDATAAHRGRP